MVGIDKKKYRIKSSRYYKSINEKSQIILAGSHRKGNLHLKRYKYKDGGTSKDHPTYSISRNGIIYEHFDPKYYTDFMGNKDVDKKSISVVLENMGGLFYDFETDTYMNWIHDQCDYELVYQSKWNGHIYWEMYTTEQHKSVVILCDYLINKFTIERDCIGFNVYHPDTKDFEGIVSRSNYNLDNIDLNPSFDFQYLLKNLDIEFE